MAQRTVITQSHIRALKQVFKDDPCPSREVRHKLAARLSLTDKTIRIWFQNQRTKARSAGKLPVFSHTHRNRFLSTRTPYHAKPSTGLPALSPASDNTEAINPTKPTTTNYKTHDVLPLASSKPLDLTNGFMTQEEFNRVIPYLPHPSITHIDAFF
ncbi:hypothetical protein DSO57_1032250 [Entomophthora muscae]|uniref:Uncharacterized protein n=1 Tax=Entomophthora muscae TaxID=34485 RepID=A0ACC2RRF4_9FUNG|nr:hypothetical protein DSO57_1032250 [Entomophthora muscae]